jgi:hypothetical protein
MIYGQSPELLQPYQAPIKHLQQATWLQPTQATHLHTCIVVLINQERLNHDQDLVHIWPHLQKYCKAAGMFTDTTESTTKGCTGHDRAQHFHLIAGCALQAMSMVAG